MQGTDPEMEVGPSKWRNNLFMHHYDKNKFDKISLLSCFNLHLYISFKKKKKDSDNKSSVVGTNFAGVFLLLGCRQV